jgi:hypothetical protein
VSIVLEYLKDHDWEGLRQRLDTLAGYVRAPLPSARVRNVAAQSFLSGAVTTLSFDVEDFNVGALHSSTNPTRLTAHIAGLYEIGTNLEWSANTAGERYVDFLLNGANVIARIRQNPAVGGDAEQNMVTLFRLNPNDYVEVRAYQSSGATLTILGNSYYTPVFWMVRHGGFANEGVA